MCVCVYDRSFVAFQLHPIERYCFIPGNNDYSLFDNASTPWASQTNATSEHFILPDYVNFALVWNAFLSIEYRNCCQEDKRFTHESSNKNWRQYLSISGANMY